VTRGDALELVPAVQLQCDFLNHFLALTS
jgi:hypothetical protein